ncbi:MAG: hypothetical protein PHG16_08265 [Lachnospiraceae bacterium]|nr:hypothetical protein [Lachnospiraceae bacterium]
MYNQQHMQTQLQFGEVNHQAGREFKARLFHMIFEDRKELLSLYNAMNNTHYTDPGLLQINTLENAIYMGMENDLSFLINSQMFVYEHQSTYNKNIPLREFLYAATLYAGLTAQANIYGTKLIKIPTPQFVTFYNGSTKRPEREIMRLSDAFTVPSEDISLELKVLALNINPGYNTKLLSDCKTLGDYMKYTEKVRSYVKVMSLSDAVEFAINECIRNNILADFLRKNKAEAKNVSIFEYDEVRHMELEREESYQEGHIQGQLQGQLQVLRDLIEEGIITKEKAAEKMNLSVEEFMEKTKEL